MSTLYSPEHLETIKNEYDFTAKSIGFVKENYNFYARIHGSENINLTLSNMEAKRLELGFKIDFLTNFLSS